MDIVLIAWSKLSRRTVNLARELNGKIVFLKGSFPYILAWKETPKILEKLRPKIVFVQLPQGPLLYKVLKISKILNFKVVADVHSGFVYHSTIGEFLLNKFFINFLRQVDLVIAHNPLQMDFMIKKLKLNKNKLMVVYDPLTKPLNTLVKPNLDVQPRDYFILPASWAPDEPIDFVVREFIDANIPEKLVITNDFSRNMLLYKKILKILKRKNAIHKVLFSGRLTDEEYYWLLKNSKLVIALTNKEYTMLCAIWEAVSYNVGFLTSETRTLKTIIGDFPFFFQLKETSLSRILRQVDKANDKVFYNTLNKLRDLSQRSIEEFKKKIVEFLFLY